MEINRDLYQHPKLITVFGGSGFIGRHLVAVLTKAGYRVRVAVRHPEQAYYMKQIGDVGQVELLPTDVCHEQAVARALWQASAAIFLAGSLRKNDIKNFKDIQKIGTKLVAKQAQKQEIPLLHFSSIITSGHSSLVYRKFKAAGEDNIRKYHPEAIIARPSIVFGPEDRFINRIASASRVRPMCVFAKSSIKLTPIYVMDIAQFVLQALHGKVETGKTYALEGPETFCVGQIVDIVLETVKRERKVLFLSRLSANIAVALSKLPLLPNKLDDEHIALFYRQAKRYKTIEDGLGSAAITGTTLQAIIPSYAWRYRVDGQFTQKAVPDWSR